MRRSVAFGLVAAIVVLAACGGGEGAAGGDAGGATSPPAGAGGTASPTVEVSPTEGSPTGPVPDDEAGGSALVGVWTIGLQDKLRALLEPYGGVPAGLSCSGAENLMFGEDGAFLATLNGRCRFLGKAGRVQGEQAGEYREQGDVFVLEGVVGRVSGEIEGIPVPIAAWDRVTRPVPYRVEGDTLTIPVRMPGGATVELTYRRF